MATVTTRTGWTRSRRGNLTRMWGRFRVTVFRTRCPVGSPDRLRTGRYRFSLYDGVDVGYCEETYATEADAVRAAENVLNELGNTE